MNEVILLGDSELSPTLRLYRNSKINRIGTMDINDSPAPIRLEDNSSLFADQIILDWDSSISNPQNIEAVELREGSRFVVKDFNLTGFTANNIGKGIYAVDGAIAIIEDGTFNTVVTALEVDRGSLIKVTDSYSSGSVSGNEFVIDGISASNTVDATSGSSIYKG